MYTAAAVVGDGSSGLRQQWAVATAAGVDIHGGDSSVRCYLGDSSSGDCSRGAKTNTLHLPHLTFLYTSICHTHARSCSYVPAYMSEFAYCSTRMLCQHNTCRTHRGDRNIPRTLMSRLNAFHGTQATKFSTPAPMNELKTFQHIHSDYELFFPIPAAAKFLHLCNLNSS